MRSSLGADRLVGSEGLCLVVGGSAYLAAVPGRALVGRVAEVAALVAEEVDGVGAGVVVWVPVAVRRYLDGGEEGVDREWVSLGGVGMLLGGVVDDKLARLGDGPAGDLWVGEIRAGHIVS